MSSLMDALNPNAVRRRPTYEHHAQVNAGHNSRPINAIQQPANGLQELAQSVEAERQRRLAWERSQELVQNQRHRELEGQITQMSAEIAALKKAASGSSHPSTPYQPHSYPLSPESLQSSSSNPPAFVQGSSTDVYLAPSFRHPPGDTLIGPDIMGLHSSAFTPSPSPPIIMPTTINPRELRGETPTTTRRKRAASSVSSDDDESGYSDASDAPSRTKRREVEENKLVCTTIHQAMRAHFAKLMQLEPSNNQLPDSHPEDEPPLEAHEPLRYVWSKTTKQSPHNQRMKARVLADIRASRRACYMHVPEKDFNNSKTLETAYDSIYRSHRDAVHALKAKQQGAPEKRKTSGGKR